MQHYDFYVYLLTNKNNTVLYVGVTNNLTKRLEEHKNKLNSGCTKKYNVDKLIYFEYFSQIEEAIAREKQVKGWKRDKKEALINKDNPTWKDLFEEFF